MRAAAFLLGLCACACATGRRPDVRDTRAIRANMAPPPYPGRGPGRGGPTAAGLLDFSRDVLGEPFQQGISSWYGEPFHGRKTANGEVYDMTMYTAAHRTLPLGTWIRVTNVATGRWVDVWVNDRGPYVDGRIIDLSWAAANEIGIVDQGLAEVRLSYLRLP